MDDIDCPHWLEQPDKKLLDTLKRIVYRANPDLTDDPRLTLMQIRARAMNAIKEARINEQSSAVREV